MNKLRMLIMIFVFLGTIFILPKTNHACSCAPIDIIEQIRAHDLIFSGTVSHIQKPIGFVVSSADEMKVTMQVDQQWKGNVSFETIIFTAQSSVSCGYPFVMNESYLVYATQHDGKVRTGLCTATKLLTDASEDLQHLGEGTPVIPMPIATPVRLSLLKLSIASILFVIFAFILYRSYRLKRNM